MGKQKTSALTTGGIVIALIIISLYAGTLIKNNRMFFAALATYIACIPYIRNGIRTGLITYGASAILALILLPNKIYAGIYVFLGIYPYVKYLCEKRKNKWIEYTLKYGWFNITMVLIYFVFKELIYVASFINNFSAIVLSILLLQVVFFVYDFIFTKFILYVDSKLNNFV